MTRASLPRRPAGRGGRGVPPGAGLPGAGAPGAGRYGLLLALLILTYLLSAFSFSTLAEDLQIGLFLGVLLLTLRTAQVARRTALVIAVVALAGTAAAALAALTRTSAGDGAADLWKGLILLLTTVLIVRRVLARPTVTVQSIYGALSAYLIIGLMFAAFYGAIYHLSGESFFVQQPPSDNNTQNFQYFSFTTLTTLGYGDFTAASDGGRAVAVMEALTGQVFLATLVARLVAAFRGSAERGRPAASRRRPRSTAGRGTGMSYRRKQTAALRARSAAPRDPPSARRSR
jgi:hypothetical protein